MAQAGTDVTGAANTSAGADVMELNMAELDAITAGAGKPLKPRPGKPKATGLRRADSVSPVAVRKVVSIAGRGETTARIAQRVGGLGQIRNRRR